jgi:ornithine decarboxylase
MLGSTIRVRRRKLRDFKPELRATASAGSEATHPDPFGQHPASEDTMTLAAFGSVEELLLQKTTDTPVFCFYPNALRAAARCFVEGFPGQVLYAVKANPSPHVIRWIIDGGVREFDTASIAEIAQVRGILEDARCSYNHPVKHRNAIAAAHRDWGIRDFVVDHMAELDKLLEEAGSDIVVQVRVATLNPHATISFNAKFGAAPGEAVRLLRAVAQRGATPAVSTHLGYQTTDPGAFGKGLQLVAQVVEAAGIHAAYVNVGGGFPSILLPKGSSLKDYFRVIGATHAVESSISAAPLKCEPGSALAHPGAGVLTQVLLVKDNSIYINDGIYGALAELIHSKIQPPTRVLMRDGSERTGTLRHFTVFGPTCDSYDTIPVPFELPSALREGDWLQLGMMGAYSSALITDFNGLGAHEFAVIGDY